MRLTELYAACTHSRFLIFLWSITLTYCLTLLMYTYMCKLYVTKSYMTYLEYESLLNNIKNMLQPLGYCDFYMDSTAHQDTDYVHVFAVKQSFVVHEFKIKYNGTNLGEVSEVNMVTHDELPLHNNLLHLST